MAEPNHGSQDWSAYNYWAPTAPPQTSGSAVASLVLGILSLVMCPITAIPGLVLGISARRRIRDSAGRETGDGLAVAGVVTSILGIVLMIVGVILVMVLLVGIGSTTVQVDNVETRPPEF